VTLEKDFAKQVEMILDYRGWLWKHDEPARRQSGKWATAMKGTKGFPDYIAVRDDRIVLAELKSEKGRLSEEQRQWLTSLEGTGKVEVYVWRPQDLSRIGEILR
jgi:hypothetical protein